MDDQQIALFGSWTQAIGTVLSAIGSTPFERLEQEILDDLNLWGNVLQATGNALVADGTEENSLEKVGNAVQAIGNSTVLYGNILFSGEEQEQLLVIKGNLIQALGGGVALGYELDQRKTSGLTYNIVGNYLQVIGNSLQAFGGKYELKNANSAKSQSYEVSGSWIQAVGAVISAVGQTNETLVDED